MTGGSSGLSSPSLEMETSAASTSWDCLRLPASLKMEPRRLGFLCFGVSGRAGLEEEELGVGLPAGSTIDLDLSRLVLRNLGSLGPWLEVVGDEGEGDARDGLVDIVVVVVDGKRRVERGRRRCGATRAPPAPNTPFPLQPPPSLSLRPLQPSNAELLSQGCARCMYNVDC